MFIDRDWKKEANKITNSRPEEKKSNLLFYVIPVFLIFLLAVGLAFWFIKKRSSDSSSSEKTVSRGQETATTTGGFLPPDFGNGNDDQYALGTSTENIKAEDLTFGHFYESPEDDFVSSLGSYDLPINVKIDVSNFYDTSRKINLDPYVDDLNQYGFAVMSAPAAITNTDFFSAYGYLLEKEIPVAITEDFLVYYFQNTLKQVFKEIEKNAFYENVWVINKKLYDTSLARYRESLEERGLKNDPVMEGERLELAFFAVALKLLEPTKAQVNTNVNFSDNTKFNLQDAENYSFEMPDYLKEDVEKEVEMIRASARLEKSPVFLYQRDYKNFLVPINYRNNAKLNNFYLTLKWLNSVFPMYYRDEYCPDCLLDRDDWAINMAAAALIAKDFYGNQETKNQWAIIYKFISFFTGLRGDLTYLNYHSAYSDLFGEDYDIRSIFSYENENRLSDMQMIQARLAEFEFSDLEGGLSRDDPVVRPNLGMRILQESYWPNTYVFNRLIGKDMTHIDKIGLSENKTKCDDRGYGDIFRCNGFSYDILNMVYPVEMTSGYFATNTNYLFYDERISSLRWDIDEFDIYTWNNNIYWANLDMMRLFLRYDRFGRPVFTRSDKWLQERDFNTFLSAWTNLHLTDDLFVNYYESDSQNLGTFKQCNKFNYIEPNIELVNEMVSRNNMLVKMMKALDVSKETNTAAGTLKELNKKLAEITAISKKELANEELNDDDCRFISDLIKQKIEIKGTRYFTLEFRNEFGVRNMRESIDGIKLIAMIYQYNDQKVIVIGPMFNFREN